jgi:hypothetical protein
MKLTIVLIVIFGLAAGKVLPEVDVTSRNSDFKGRVDYPTEYDEETFDKVNSYSIRSIEINDIKNGVIIINKKSEKTDEIKKAEENYYSHNLICHPLQELNGENEIKNECLLQYLTIHSFTLKLSQFKFVVSSDSKNSLGSKLEEGKTCTIKNIVADYQLFSIPGTKEKNLDFNTRTKKFELNGEIIVGEPIIEFKGDKVILKIGKMKFAFTKDNSCYLLLQKIQYLLNMPVEECQNTTFVYFNLYATSNSVEVPLDIPDVGFIKIDALNGITFKDRSELRLKNIYENLKTSERELLVYEKDSYDFNLLSGDIQYSMNLYYGNQYCKEKIKNIITKRSSSCVFMGYGGDSFYYYRRYDLQKDEEEKLLGEIEYLKFQAHKGIVEEYNIKDHLLNKIRIFYMKLISCKETEKWLYIKGIDGKGEIVNKKYYMKFPSDDVTCSKQFGNVQKDLNKFYNALAKNRKKLFFWQVDESFKPEYKLKGNLIAMGVITYNSGNTDNSDEVKVDGTKKIKNAVTGKNHTEYPPAWGYPPEN